MNEIQANNTIRCDQVYIGNLMIATTTALNKPIHYTVYLSVDGVDHLLTAWYDVLSVRCKRTSEIIAEAYQRVFMWIRPQLSNDLFIDNLNDRDMFLRTLSDLYMKVFGIDNSLRPEQYIYHDVRKLVSAEGTARLFRTYDPVLECFTSTMALTPVQTVGNAKCLVSISDRELDPGDWIDGEWTPAARDPSNHIPISDEGDSSNERPTIVY